MGPDRLTGTLRAPWKAAQARARVPCLDVSREGHVDLLPVGGDPVQQQSVVHGAVPRGLELVEGPARKQT